MFNTNPSKTGVSRKESGNAVVIVLAVLVVVAVGALAYLSGQMAGEQKAPQIAAASAAPAAGETQRAAAENQAPPIEIKPGNPVVAKIGDEDVLRLDVFNYIQTLPPNTRQLPIGQLFPVAMEQVINARVINNKTKNVKLDNDPEVKKQLAVAKENIVRSVYVQNQVTERITDEHMKQAYEAYKAQFPKVEEVKASHILVAEEKQAEDVIAQLEAGGDFAELAKANSTDGTAENGGELGYFTKTDVVPPFAEAAFSTEPGSFTAKPVKSDFGFHVIKIEEKRMRPPAEFEAAKPFLETQLRRAMLEQVMIEWRDASDVTRFDINGEEIEPAAGTETEAPTEAVTESE